MALWFARAARKLRRLPPAAARSIFPFASPPPVPSLSSIPDIRGSLVPRPSHPPWAGSPLLVGFPHRLSFASLSGSSDETEGDGVARRPEAGAVEAPPSWLDAYLPASVRPYAQLARLDKPIGIWLLAWPCAWYCLFLFIFLHLLVRFSLRNNIYVCNYSSRKKN